MGFSRQEYWSGVPLPSPQIQLALRNHRPSVHWYRGPTVLCDLIQGTWVSTDCGTHRGSWTQGPVDTEEWLCVTQWVIRCLSSISSMRYCCPFQLFWEAKPAACNFHKWKSLAQPHKSQRAFVFQKYESRNGSSGWIKYPPNRWSVGWARWLT